MDGLAVATIAFPSPAGPSLAIPLATKRLRVSAAARDAYAANSIAMRRRRRRPSGDVPRSRAGAVTPPGRKGAGPNLHMQMVRIRPASAGSCFRARRKTSLTARGRQYQRQCQACMPDASKRETESAMKRPTPLQAAATGLAAGVVGTGFMTAWQELAAKLKPSPDGGAESQQPPSDQWEAASAPAKVAKRIGEGVFHKPVSPDLIPLLTNSMHWGYGTGWGTVYGIAAGSARSAPGLTRGRRVRHGRLGDVLRPAGPDGPVRPAMENPTTGARARSLLPPRLRHRRRWRLSTTQARLNGLSPSPLDGPGSPVGTPRPRHLRHTNTAVAEHPAGVYTHLVSHPQTGRSLGGVHPRVGRGHEHRATEGHDQLLLRRRPGRQAGASASDCGRLNAEVQTPANSLDDVTPCSCEQWSGAQMLASVGARSRFACFDEPFCPARTGD